MAQPEPSSDQFYEACLRLRQLCVGKRDFILRQLGVSRAQYYADQDRYRVHLQCQLRAWGMDLEE